MMIESECNRASPVNARHRHNFISASQCEVSTGDINVASGTPIQKKRISVCIGCGQEIYDQYILRVAPDLEWHAACLKCVDCQQFLDESCTCFVRDGKTYCRRDYVRHFGVKCAKCGQLFHKNDYVMRARNKIYHIDCFRCTTCSRLLMPGDEFALRDDGLFCKADHESMPSSIPVSTTTTTAEETIAALCDPTGSSGIVDSTVAGGDLEMLGGGPLSSFHHPSNESGRTPPMGFPITSRPLSTPLGLDGNAQQPHPLSSTLTSQPGPLHHQQSSSCSVSSPESLAGDERCNSGHGGGTDQGSAGSVSGVGNGSTSGVKKEKKDKPKTTRVRTVLNEKQLHTLRTCYGANPRPDALMKEQLVEMTGLSPRVIRVWFQNKRCKDKKKQILMKQIQQQQEKNQALNGVRIQGVGPLIAQSPTRHHDMSMIQPVDVHQYQQSSALWVKAQSMAPSINEYHHHGPPIPPEHTLHPMESHHPTPFQQLMHGFGDPRAAEAAALGGCYMPPPAPGFGPPVVSQALHGGCMGGLDSTDLGSLSPHLAPSDLSSPSCSE